MLTALRVLAVSLLVSSCASIFPAPSVTGTWKVFEDNGSAHTLTLFESGTTLTGRWADLVDVTNGSRSGSHISFRINDAVYDGEESGDGNTISGTYTLDGSHGFQATRSN